jgi:hypothetical protein
MKEQIGQTAGKIWKVLKEKDALTPTQLSRAVKEKAAMVQLGLGWLAREDKVTFRKKGDKIFVSLVDSEK